MKFLNLGESHNVLIMNGLPFYPYFWSFKCLSHVKGQCVIHYVLTHMELLNCILLFNCFTPFQRTLCISPCLGPQGNTLFYHPLLNLPIPLLIIPSHRPLQNPLPTPHYCMLIYTFIQYLLSMLYISLFHHLKKYTTRFVFFFTQLCNFVQGILLTSAPRIGKTL